MAKTYCTCIGMRGEATRCGGNDGVRVSAQSYDGSIIVRNYYNDDNELRVRVGTNEGSSCYTDWKSTDFNGTFEEFKALLRLNQDIKDGKVSVVRHRKPKVGYNNIEEAD